MDQFCCSEYTFIRLCSLFLPVPTFPLHEVFSWLLRSLWCECLHHLTQFKWLPLVVVLRALTVWHKWCVCVSILPDCTPFKRTLVDLCSRLPCSLYWRQWLHCIGVYFHNIASSLPFIVNITHQAHAQPWPTSRRRGSDINGGWTRVAFLISLTLGVQV